MPYRISGQLPQAPHFSTDERFCFARRASVSEPSESLERDVDSHARRVKASASSCRHHCDSLDDQPDELPPLAEVGLCPQLLRVGMQDNPPLAGSVDAGVESLDLPL